MRAGEGHPISFIDLGRQRDRIRRGIDAAIGKVLDHGQFIMGPEVSELERRLAQFCGARHAIACGSGTEALVLALMAKGLRPGDAVIVPSFTFCATAEAVCLLGGVPIFADVREETANIDPRSVGVAVLTARRLGLPLRGLISVDLFGQPCEYDLLEEIVGENGLWMISDAAQSFGASYRGRKVGVIGDATATSFFPAKPLGCYGDGGAVFTDDDALAEIARSLRVHGQGRDKYDNVRIGINGRLDTIQAAILLQKLAIFPEEIALRNCVAAHYDEILPADVGLPLVVDGANSVWAQYTIRVQDRSARMARLQEAGVPAVVYYPRPLHLQTAYRSFPTADDHLDTATRLADTVLSLPMHPYLLPEEQDRIAVSLAGSPPQRGSIVTGQLAAEAGPSYRTGPPDHRTGWRPRQSRT
jgi:dTDP-4-amino-4,6-dideoxygalactose transaminase